ncbi:MAG TPA: hypothetical protein VFJ89_07345 [Nocardioides sp.]|jgi:hypothetical protein|nr:hypothetical protein [Nocardioides sp.]
MNEHDDLTTTLSRELGERAGEMDGSTLHLTDVKGRARTIRRRRTATAVVGAVAAVGLIVPTAALATHSGGKPEPAPATQTTQSPSPTTATDATGPAPGVLDVSDLPTGAAPAMDYLENGTLHFADGGTGRVNTRYTPSGFVEMEDGSRVWQTTDENGRSYVEIQDTDGTFHDPVRTDDGLSVNPKHSIVAWLTPAGQVVVWGARATEPTPLGDPVPGSGLRLGPVIGDDCSLACSVIVNVQDRTSQPWEVSDSGSQPLLDGGYLVVNDESEAGLSVGFTDITDFKTCSTLLGGGEFQGFKTCKNQLSSFSPDGRLILALPSYFDGIGPGGIGMYDLEGTRLFDRGSTEATQAYLTEATWEDDTHVLAPTYQDGQWALVRYASDGTMEYAVAPAKGPYDQSPFVLPIGGGLPGA